ncbi:IS6 family transposase [Bradyrhizobium diazoefficiens]|uniref:IS6 family transposase n=1 Tax=Bradyrhizobium diazoefficiens TaxID=1355477 RepID=UPI00348A2B23
MRTAKHPLYRRHRFPPEVISYAVWLYFRFPLSLRMVEEMLAARGIGVTYETVRQWGRKFGKPFSDRIRQRAPARGDKWHLDEVVISIAGEQHWLWRAVDQNGFVLDVLIQRRRDSRAAQRITKKLLKSAGTPPRVMDHGQAPFVRRCEGEDGLARRTSPAQSSQQSGRELSSADAATRADHEAFKSSHQAQRFLSVHDQVANLFHIPYPGAATAAFRRASRERAFATSYGGIWVMTV